MHPGNIMTPEDLLTEVDDVIRSMPPRATIAHELPENLEWFGRASAVLHAWSLPAATSYDMELKQFQTNMGRERGQNLVAMLTTLNRMRSSLQMQVRGPLTTVVDKGKVFDYFDEVRKIIELAKTDVFFVDPYLDAEFVPRYLSHVASGVPVRLLASDRMKTLVPAVQMFASQNGLKVEVRSAKFHDRYVFIDERECYQSGASFKDGGKHSITTLTQIVDAFEDVKARYEKLWNDGKTELHIV